MKLDFSGLQTEYKRYETQYVDIFKRVMSSGRMFQGPETEKFEATLAKIVGRKYAIAVGSCTDALYFAIRALELTGSVVVPDLSFIASASCILRAGCDPYFVDVDDDGLLDWRKIPPNPKAILYVHLFGQLSRYFVNNSVYRNCIIIEDAAQAIGATHEGRQAGSFGDVSCISFDPMKNISSPIGGGVVLTDDPFIARKIQGYRYHGRDTGYQFWGSNSQMSEIAAAFLNFKLKHLESNAENRRYVADRYIEGLMDLDISLLTPSSEKERDVWHKFAIRTEHRDKLSEYLVERWIPTKIHYPYALHRLPMFGERYSDNLFRKTLDFVDCGLSLPIHPFLTDDEIDYVIDTIHMYFKGF